MYESLHPRVLEVVASVYRSAAIAIAIEDAIRRGEKGKRSPFHKGFVLPPLIPGEFVR